VTAARPRAGFDGGSLPIPPHDPLALSEGFCPDCRVPLAGPDLNHCRVCKAWWYQYGGHSRGDELRGKVRVA